MGMARHHSSLAKLEAIHVTQKQRCYCATDGNQKWTFCVLEQWFFGKIASIRVSTLCNTNKIATSYIIGEKNSVPVFFLWS